MKKALKITFVVLSSLVVALVVTAFVIWTYPSILITQKNVKRLADYLDKQGYHFEWREFEVNSGSKSFWTKWVNLRARDFCFEMKDPVVDVCFRQVEIPMEVDLHGFSYRLRPGSILLTEGDIHIFIPESGDKDKEKKPTEPEELFPRPPEFLKTLNLSFADIQINRFRYLDGEDLIAADGRLIYRDKNLKANVNVILPKKEKIHANLELKPQSDDKAAYQLLVNYLDGKQKWNGDLSGTIDFLGLNGRLKTQKLILGGDLPDIFAKDCHFDYHHSAKTVGEEKLHLNCPMEVEGRIPGVRYVKGLNDSRRKINLLLKADLARKDRPGQPGYVAGQVSVLVDALLSEIKQGRTTVETAVEGQLSSFPKNWKFDSKLVLAVDQFEKLVTMLRPTPWAVPQPFGNLGGKVEINVDGKGQWGETGLHFPLRLTTRLGSKVQKMDLDGTGAFKITPLKAGYKSHLDFDLSLSDLQLVLPDLGLQEPPQLVPDKRFKSSKEMEAKREPAVVSAFTYLINISTPDGRPARLVSNLVEEKVPVSLSLRLENDKAMEGSLRLMPFDLEMFRRKANFKRLDIKFADDPDLTEINGEIQIAYADYTIRILILGKLNQPQIKFLSEPVLSEAQVIAVLIFGKTLDALETEQAQTVSNTRAAVADSAVSLASMYLLASTPIESVGYDPSTGNFNAKVRLADGTSLNVGSDMKQLNKLGVRQRLGSNFAITTYLLNPMEPVKRTLAAFLEWSKRY